MTSQPSPLAGRNILCTGATGSFGNAFVRRALADGARRVVVFSRSESKQAAMAAELNDDRLRFMIGDVRDARRVAEACRGVEILAHAAALKRVEVCESQPAEAVATNVEGTLNVARACIAAGVERAIILSTDKAAAPNTLYGMTKATGERVWIAANTYAAGTQTRFAASRYGNVASSTGSVIPLWKAQRAAGLPLTITDVTCTRFFMSMSEAVDLVILALATMRGGETVVPKIKAAPIIDLARAIAEADGQVYAPGHIETGLRPSEKRHELLISADEAPYTYDAGTHFIIEPATRTWGEVAPLGLPRVPDGFSFSSDRAPVLTGDELRRLVA